MREEHLGAVIAIEQAGCAAPWSRALLASELANRLTLAFVATKSPASRAISGHIFLRTAADEAEVLILTVSPGMRRRGIGQMLLGYGLAQARERGARNCFLEVRVSNCAARRLYERMGFIEVGRRPNYYLEPLEDGVIMQCSLHTNVEKGGNFCET